MTSYMTPPEVADLRAAQTVTPATRRAALAAERAQRVTP